MRRVVSYQKSVLAMHWPTFLSLVEEPYRKTLQKSFYIFHEVKTKESYICRAPRELRITKILFLLT
ncbi:MAG: hypothetical protein ACI9O6_002498 [Glaciecola sp.]|jgi:hypothetical protein